MTEKSAALQRSIAHFKENLRELIKHRGEDFSLLVCEGVLAEPGAEVPFALPKIDASDSVGRMYLRSRDQYSYLASLLIRQRSPLPKTPQPEYIWVGEWVENREKLDQRFYRLDDFPFLANDDFPEVEDIWRPFFANCAGIIGGSITYLASMLHDGLPLYEQCEDGGFRLVPAADEDFVYLRQRGKRYETVPEYELPDYIKRFYIKPAHEKWHDIIFTFDGLLSEQEFQDRKAALIRQAGVAPPVLAQGAGAFIQSETYDKLQSALGGFPIRFPMYQAKKPKLDVEVRPWLKSAYGLSDREAHVFGTIIAESFEL
ncbi:MAG: hypothetical protein HGA71_06990 [Azonexaceae bacterium]|nr:hypothetical protein [Azonexaceae bacterium]